MNKKEKITDKRYFHTKTYDDYVELYNRRCSSSDDKLMTREEWTSYNDYMIFVDKREILSYAFAKYCSFSTDDDYVLVSIDDFGPFIRQMREVFPLHRQWGYYGDGIDAIFSDDTISFKWTDVIGTKFLTKKELIEVLSANEEGFNKIDKLNDVSYEQYLDFRKDPERLSR